MNVIVLVLSMVAAAASYKLVPYPPPGCEKCLSDPERCIYDPVYCVMAPCPQYRCARIKPGECPRMTVEGSECEHDEQCLGLKKCCRGNCVTVKVDPCGGCKSGYVCLPTNVVCVKDPCEPQYRCVSTFPKDGKCPIMIAQHFDECIYDDQCFGKMKCCNGKCVTPEITERPGRCPYYPLRLCLPKKDTCAFDTDCKAPMKCCGYCGKECEMPLPKPGVCPVSRRACLLEIKRKDQCTNDFECKGDDKCCRDECGTLVCVSYLNINI